jgi:hypothetical protein
MSRLLILLFFPLTLLAQAQWTEKPIAHWSCAPHKDGKGTMHYFIADPNAPLGTKPDCLLAPSSYGGLRGLGYDPATREEINFALTKKVPESGIVRFDWPDVFLKIPGCNLVQGDVKEWIEHMKDHLTIHSKPGETLVLHCYGLVERPKISVETKEKTQ